MLADADINPRSQSGNAPCSGCKPRTSDLWDKKRRHLGRRDGALFLPDVPREEVQLHSKLAATFREEDGKPTAYSANISASLHCNNSLCCNAAMLTMQCYILGASDIFLPDFCASYAQQQLGVERSSPPTLSSSQKYPKVREAIVTVDTLEETRSSNHQGIAERIGGRRIVFAPTGMKRVAENSRPFAKLESVLSCCWSRLMLGEDLEIML